MGKRRTESTFFPTMTIIMIAVMTIIMIATPTPTAAFLNGVSGIGRRRRRRRRRLVEKGMHERLLRRQGCGGVRLCRTGGGSGGGSGREVGR